MEVKNKSNLLDAPSEAPASSNITADEFDDETVTKLRGDAIGNTMYSEVFVLNTLLQFSNLKWNKETEDNLCFLWDMTEDQDVCQYLFKVSYPSLACSAIQNYTEPRFIEIVVGIFANLLCSQCDKSVDETEIIPVLNLLNSDDPYILIQVLRFMHAVSFLYDKLDFIGKEHLNKLDFILANSRNNDLLGGTLKSLAAITSDTKLMKEHALQLDLLKPVMIAYKVLKEDCETEFDMFVSKEKLLNVRYLIQFMCNICSYVNILGRDELANKLTSNLEEFTNEIVILLNYYKSVNVLLMDEEFVFHMDAVTYIYRVLDVGYISSVAKVLFHIFLTIYYINPSNLITVAELFCYFVAKGSLEDFQTDFCTSSSEEVKMILLHVKKNFSFEFDYHSNLNLILQAL